VYGTTDDHDPRRRTITYEVAPLASDGMEIPAIPFAFYDPGPPPGYRVVRTSPLPLPDRGPAPAAGLPGPHTGAGPSGGEAAAPAGAGWIAAVAGLGLVALAAAGAWVVARGRRPPPAEVPVDPAGARRAAATAAVRAALGRPGARAPAGDPRAPPDPALADAFAEFLAAHLGLPTAAAIGPDLPGRLAAADVPPIAAARAATVLERLVGARYGGRDATVEAESAVGGLVDELEACFRSHRGG
jgi:hypothetical protein